MSSLIYVISYCSREEIRVVYCHTSRSIALKSGMEQSTTNVQLGIETVTTGNSLGTARHSL